MRMLTRALLILLKSINHAFCSLIISDYTVKMNFKLQCPNVYIPERELIFILFSISLK